MQYSADISPHTLPTNKAFDDIRSRSSPPSIQSVDSASITPTDFTGDVTYGRKETFEDIDVGERPDRQTYESTTTESEPDSAATSNSSNDIISYKSDFKDWNSNG